MSYKLLMKVSDEGLSYLCVTTRKDYKKYSGSGKYWKQFLKTHKPQVCTALLFESDNLEEFNAMCRSYSAYFEVDTDDQWANLIPEYGYDAFPLRDKVKEYWANLSDSQKELINKLKRETQIAYWERISPDKRKIHGENVSKGRLNMSPEAKEERRKKVAAHFLRDSQGKFINPKIENMFSRYREERKSGGNPAARSINFLGKTYECVQDAQRNNPEYSIYKITKMIKNKVEGCEYLSGNDRQFEPVKCPHCQKEGKSSSSFYRWHMKNCKENKNNE